VPRDALLAAPDAACGLLLALHHCRDGPDESELMRSDQHVVGLTSHAQCVATCLMQLTLLCSVQHLAFSTLLRQHLVSGLLNLTADTRASGGYPAAFYPLHSSLPAQGTALQLPGTTTVGGHNPPVHAAAAAADAGVVPQQEPWEIPLPEDEDEAVHHGLASGLANGIATNGTAQPPPSSPSLTRMLQNGVQGWIKSGKEAVMGLFGASKQQQGGGTSGVLPAHGAGNTSGGTTTTTTCDTSGLGTSGACVGVGLSLDASQDRYASRPGGGSIAATKGNTAGAQWGASHKRSAADMEGGSDNEHYMTPPEGSHDLGGDLAAVLHHAGLGQETADHGSLSDSPSDSHAAKRPCTGGGAAALAPTAAGCTPSLASPNLGNTSVVQRGTSRTLGTTGSTAVPPFFGLKGGARAKVVERKQSAGSGKAPAPSGTAATLQHQQVGAVVQSDFSITSAQLHDEHCPWPAPYPVWL
jgi:hypothetical protein